MAHDKQYKDSMTARIVKRYARPEKGELYWDRDKHRVLEAEEDMDTKHLIIEREVEE